MESEIFLYFYQYFAIHSWAPNIFDSLLGLPFQTGRLLEFWFAWILVCSNSLLCLDSRLFRRQSLYNFHNAKSFTLSLCQRYSAGKTSAFHRVFEPKTFRLLRTSSLDFEVQRSEMPALSLASFPFFSLNLCT